MYQLLSSLLPFTESDLVEHNLLNCKKLFRLRQAADPVVNTVLNLPIVEIAPEEPVFDPMESVFNILGRTDSVNLNSQRYCSKCQQALYSADLLTNVHYIPDNADILCSGFVYLPMEIIG